MGMLAPESAGVASAGAVAASAGSAGFAKSSIAGLAPSNFVRGGSVLLFTLTNRSVTNTESGAIIHSKTLFCFGPLLFAIRSDAVYIGDENKKKRTS
jgi:hypothetical protein